MKETGLLCSAEMVGAYLGGRKTVTRRLWGLKKINENPDGWFVIPAQANDREWCFYDATCIKSAPVIIKCPYGGVGDLLYIKETWAEQSGDIYYKADWPNGKPVNMACDNIPWHSPRFMFKFVARIWLEIVSVRPARLQEITEEDCKAEGIHGYTFARGCCSENPPDSRWAFIELWDSINPKYLWASNPFVWRIESKRIER